METICSLLEIEKDADDNVIFSWKKYSIRFCLQKQKKIDVSNGKRNILTGKVIFIFQ